MSITLNLTNAEGALFPNANRGDNDPVLEGFATFALSNDKDGPTLRLNAAAWAKDKDGKKFYSLSLGGLNGALFPEDPKKKKSDKAPDYTGTVGPNRELRIAAWKRTSNEGGQPFLSITIEEKRQGNGGSSDTGFSDDRRAPAGKSREPSFI